MKCADCQTSLIPSDFRGIIINECPSCQGSWFDLGELNKAKNNEDEDLCWLDFDPFQGEGDKTNIIEKSEKKICPSCEADMVSWAYGQSGVIIEICPECEGIWLHGGEFKKIIDYLENIVVTETTTEYVKDTFKKFLEIFSGKEDVVSEVRDFLVVIKLLKRRITAEHPELEAATTKIFEYLPFL